MVHRIDVWSKPDAHGDPAARAERRRLADFGYEGVPLESVRRVYLIETDADAATVSKIALGLLADPVADDADHVTRADDVRTIEVHLKPGVMDPVAASVERALADLGVPAARVRTGRAFRFAPHADDAQLHELATRVLANPVVEEVRFEPYLPESFPVAPTADNALRRVALLQLDDAGLTRLSRDGHLFLSLDEMRAVQAYFRARGVDPTDVELETIAQTWSEHCVHKTLKSLVEVVDEHGTPLRTYGNLIKETIFGSTQQLIARRGDNFCLSVFKDNAGVVAFDDADAVCFKVETHNHPSAIEPYGGAATGIGGCIRDVMGTGLAAKPVANTNVFCVAPPDAADLPTGVIDPRRTLQQVVAGVRDYGNRMGIPTVNGAVHFHDDYAANPLVFAGCVGLLPRAKVEKAARRGDLIVVLGGRTGRDGIHGATFSSAELTDTHADEFSHAVQIGNAITQKKALDVLLAARDASLFTAVTDCGAGGLSSAVGEMGADLGATVQLDRVPLKYAGLRYDEIWISEAQERMVLAVPPDGVDALLKLAASEDVEATVIGTFGTPGEALVLTHDGVEVARLAMHFLHDGIPMPTRKAVVRSHVAARRRSGDAPTDLLRALAHPNVASKAWIIRQYDHEVQGGSVVKPLVGPGEGPSDAAVFQPKPSSKKGVVVACGLSPARPGEDCYHMAVRAIDEAVRNALCVGGRLDTLALLDNFCWPGVDDEGMGQLVRACEACRDYALALGVPFISGKDSLNNQYHDAARGRTVRIPATLLISAIGVIDTVWRCVTSDLKRAGNALFLLRAPGDSLAARVATHQLAEKLIADGGVRSAHDVSDGGTLCAVAEMCLAGGLGAKLDALDEPFEEIECAYVLEVEAARADAFAAHATRLGTMSDDGHLTLGAERWSVAELQAAWSNE